MAAIPQVPPPTPEEIAIVKSTVPVLEEHGVTITTVFYENMHRENPSLNEVFNQANQKNGHQARALAASVLAYAKYIDNLAVLGDAVETICQKHASLLIKPEQYSIVGKYLLEAIKQVLGDAATDAVLSAWGACYWQLAYLFINREEEIYTEKANRDWREFTVEKKIKESDEITSFYLKPKDGKPVEEYKPGQYISVRVAVPQQEWKQIRQYSLSTSQDPEYYRISVKRACDIDAENTSHPGWVSNVLHETIREGDTLDLTFPCGSFHLDSKATPEAPVVLISGGVGLTPLMSMMNTLVDEGSDRPLTWIHSTRSQNSYAFGDYIKSVMKTKSDWHAIVYRQDLISTEHAENYKVLNGRVNLRTLGRSTDLHLDNPDTQYFICGPDSFMLDLKEVLVNLGAKADNVKYERFGTGDLVKEKPAVVIAPQVCPVSHAHAGTSGLSCPVSGLREQTTVA
ncbi:Flavohemoprotein [Arthrobotrys entomopaga]|nr:Flavohemoprotein [Arthrobotrys entomopaga]